MSQDLGVVGLGRMTYAEALDLQRTLAQKRIDGGLDRDLLLLVEHNPVVTLGRGAKDSSMALPSAEIAARGVELFEVDRGGDVTFHGPGQLVGYPILELPVDRRDVHRYVRDLEDVLIQAVGDFGIAAARIPGLTGIWVGDRKLAAIGVRISRWVTSHGFALNVSTDLSHFDLIVPCGIADKGVTSMERLLGRRVPMDEVAEAVVLRFGRVFGGSLTT